MSGRVLQVLVPRPGSLKNILDIATQEKGKSEQFRFKDSTAAKVAR